MVDKGEWEFTWNNELKGKRLQENLRFGEASCGLQNRDENLVDTWVHYAEVVRVINTSKCVLIKSGFKIFQDLVIQMPVHVAARGCS